MPPYRLMTRVPFLMIVLALLLVACSLPSASPAAPPPPPPGEPGGPPPDQPPGGSGAVQIAFAADRAQINPGECVTLTWQVSGPHFAVLLDGEQVADQGSKQVCPPNSHAFFLQVDTGDRMEERSVQVQVGAGAPPPPPSGGASPPPPPPPSGTNAPPPPPPTPTSSQVHISGKVFIDQNRNGVLDSGEPPYTAFPLKMQLYSATGGKCDTGPSYSPLAEVKINAQGEYAFTVSRAVY